MRAGKHGRGKSPTEKLRVNIGKLWDSGATQIEIADALQVPVSAVRYQLQRLGVPYDQQHKAHPVVAGKRVCVQCKENKELVRYPNPRHAICLACMRETREEKSR